MGMDHGRGFNAVVVAALAVAVALGLLLVVDPVAEPAVVLICVAGGLVFYGVLYVLERRRHW